MRAVVLMGPDRLGLRESPIPALGVVELLIQVASQESSKRRIGSSPGPCSLLSTPVLVGTELKSRSSGSLVVEQVQEWRIVGGTGLVDNTKLDFGRLETTP